MLNFTPLPPPHHHPLRQDGSPLQAWNNELLLKAYLAGVPEPQGGTNPHDLYSARLKMFRARIMELDALRGTIAPRTSADIDREIAGVMYKRMILLWLTFPILDLPNEILTTIFRYVVWSSPGADEATRLRMHLTWVCKRFRYIALSDQTLWNSIWFRDPYPWTRSLTFIERSGTAPIDCRINERDRRPNDPPNTKPPPMTVAQMNVILDALMPKISQLRIVVVVLQDINVLETFLTRFSTAGPPSSLERFEIHRSGAPYLWPHGKTSGVGGLIPLSIYDAPRLRWLCLNGLTIDFHTLPASNLRTIDLRRMTVPACPTSERWTEMLEVSSSTLFKLSLDAAGPQWAATRVTGVRPVELPHLRDLLIGDVSCVFALWILAHIRAPGVASLTLMNLTGQDYLQLIDALAGQFPAVRLLALQTFDAPKDVFGTRNVVRWLASMPRLQMLKVAGAKEVLLNSFGVDPRVFWTQEEKDEYAAILQERGEEVRVPALCPALEVLYFQGQRKNEISRMAKLRVDVGVPIKKVYTPELNVPNIVEGEIDMIKRFVGQFIHVPNLQGTPEEEAIHGDMMLSVPGHPWAGAIIARRG